MDSEKIKTFLKDWRITIPAGVILGLILGLIIGWGIWPVQWTDLAPYHLRADLREDYLRMSIYSSAAVGNDSIAIRAWSELEDTAQETFDAVRAKPEFLTPEQISAFAAKIGAEPALVVPTEEALEPVEPPEEGRGPNWWLLSGLCLVLLVAGGAVYYFVIRKQLFPQDQPETLGMHGLEDDDLRFKNEPGSQHGMQDVIQQPIEDEQATPVAQFMTTYMLGDDLYDDSFSIDAPTGEFLGECGVGISETVGVGEPKRVTAYEVWLFDKNDIQTVTKVIMSAHAFEDDKLRIRLESKGEPVLAEPGKQFLLETASLQLQARVVDMEYGEGAAPDLSFFHRLTLELAVWPKTRPQM